MFKEDFMYESTKNLVHKSQAAKNSFKRNFTEEFHIVKEEPRTRFRTVLSRGEPEHKRTKLEVLDQDSLSQEEHIELEAEQDPENDIMFDDNHSAGDPADGEVDGEKVEIVFLPQDSEFRKEIPKRRIIVPKPDLAKEEKFIAAVYPQFKGKTKLNLIDEIMDLKRRNELLQVKARTYENTINKLL